MASTPRKLRKELGLISVFCIASGAMMSSGLFLLPGLAHAQAGPAVTLSYFLAGLLAATGLLSQAELATAMPKSGGTYFYITRSMGPGVGTVYGLITLLALALKAAFALMGLAFFTQTIPELRDIPPELIASALALVFLAINFIGVKQVGRVQIYLVFSIMSLLLVYTIWGLPQVEVMNFKPFLPEVDGFSKVFATAGFVFVSYGGLLKVASIAEEVKNPGKVLPLGMLLSLLTVGLLYVVVVFITSGVLPAEELNASRTPISDGARAIFGDWGYFLLSAAAIMAFCSAANAGILAASRYPLALSRDDLLPEVFSRIHPRYDTPHYSLLLTGICMIGSVYLGLEVLVKAASTVLILTYLFSCLAIIILRESRLQNYQPSYRAPLYPWVPLVGIVGFVWLLFQMGPQALVTSFILIVVGLFIYWFYGRIRATREYALLHLIERITAAELTSHSLESELKEIIRERDEIMKDRFDHLVEECPVLDIAEPLTREDFFRRVSKALAGRLDETPELLNSQLEKREEESTTVLNPFMAIPHIVVEGEKHFDMLLARCRGGIEFSDEAPRVHAVFVLAGTKDERPFHLTALAAIAQIVQDPAFEQQWISAKGKESLRDAVLLGKRRRQ